jgi:hypothetical protein
MSVVTVLTTAAAAAGTGSRTLYVDAGAPAGGDGSNWSTAFRDLQDALDAVRTAPETDLTIKIAPGTYLPDRGTGNRASRFVLEPPSITSGVALRLIGTQMGGGDLPPGSAPLVRLTGDLLRNDGPNWSNRLDNAYTVVEIVAEQAVAQTNFLFSGIEVSGSERGCSSPNWYSDGAIKVNSGEQRVLVAFTDGVITANRSCNSAVVDVEGSYVQFDRVRVFGNRPPTEGALFISRGRADGLSLDRCTIFDNTDQRWQAGFRAYDQQSWLYFYRSSLDFGGANGIEAPGYVSMEDCEVRQSRGVSISRFRAVYVGDSRFDGSVSPGDSLGYTSAIDGVGDISISGSSFSNFTITHHGSAVWSAFSLDCTDTDFIGNRTISEGNSTAAGAACSGGGLARFSRCRFIGNSAHAPGDRAYGGAVAMSSATFVQCLFAGNSATGAEGADGGAVSLFGSGKFSLCTFFANTVAADNPLNARGPCVGGGFDGLAVASSIFWNSTGGVDTGLQRHIRGRAAHDSVAADDCNFEGMQVAPDPHGNTGANPKFIDRLGPDGIPGTIDDDLRLGSGSPCIDSGSNGLAAVDSEPDLSGLPRFHDDPMTRDRGDHTRVDRGVYEFQGVSSPAPCWADITLDERVDISDLVAMLRWFGAEVPVRFGPDLVADGVVDTRDLVKLLAGFGCDMTSR